jgi:replicative DNA helicase
MSNATEQSVIGALLLAPETFRAVEDLLTGEMFTRQVHRTLFYEIGDMVAAGEPVDAVTLAERLERSGHGRDIGAYAVQVCSQTPSAANIRAYAQLVRDDWTRQQMRAVGERIASLDGDATEVLDAALSELMRLSHTSQRHEYSLRDAMSMAYADMQATRERGGKIPGVPSGIDKLDAILGGWHDSDLIVVGSRPAMGKTSLLLNFSDAAGLTYAHGIVSAEQPAVQIAGRVMSLASGVAASQMRAGTVADEDYGKLHATIKALIARRVFIYDRSAPTIGEVCRIARKWHHQHGIKALFVDYIQRIESDKGDRKHERVGDVARQLKNLARDLNVPVIALGQVNRDVERREDKRPHMGDLSDSSEIEKEADQIIMLYRDEVYTPDSEHAGTAELLIEKNRHGPTGFVRCKWEAETMRFSNLGGGHA